MNAPTSDYRSPCPKCKGQRTQINVSIHNLPNGKGDCCICKGRGTVNAEYASEYGRRRGMR